MKYSKRKISSLHSKAGAVSIFCSKQGAASVFLIMILASVLLLVSLFIYAAIQTAGKSYADAVFVLAGRSILSEYDFALQKRYGIFALHTDEKQIEQKIRFYAGYSFHEDSVKEAFRANNHTDLLNLRLGPVDVDLKGYSLMDTELFEQQILEHMKYCLIKESDQSPDSSPHPSKDVRLRNQQIIAGLPSRGYNSSLFEDLKKIAKSGIPSLQEIKEQNVNDFLVNEYILRHFYHHSGAPVNGNSFFSNEIEYILKGNFNDTNNYNGVRTDLFLIRNVLNLSHIYNDPEKRREIEAIAAALTLSKGKEIGAVVVAEAWAAAEAENDLRLLEAGKQVPVIKRKENWALPISDTLDYLWIDGYTDPSKISGYDYEDWLRVLLYLKNRELKLLRCLDLIQINMKGTENRTFDWKEYYGGFQFEAMVKDRTFTYIQKY